MTSGDDGGTSGGAGKSRWRPSPWLAVTLVTLVVVAVNATSDYLDMSRDGSDFDWWEPFVWELSSAVAIVAMAPAIGWAVQRWSFTRDSLVRPALIHLGLTIPFSAIHIVGIFLIRNAIYAILGGRYGFFDDGVGLVLVYEWRKDVLSYAAIASFYWIFQYIEARRAAAADAARSTAGDQRIEIRDGGGAVFLNPHDILLVEAAGNYIEFHTAGRAHLVRGTLASWEARLAARGFVRVHRSRLVNRTAIGAIKPTPSGDVEIVLTDGRLIAGSRRYRSDLQQTP
ncbi:LytTR family DNA-binding domain-containing protein [Terricaulis silvestris]|uniref:Response regulator of the LytR/AlgR family protein n=1 Tax=Terricaulis silvestris TaxID=2686094 RepID=A0A6I6MT65_9CAUL|nr:LytTR family DNA-binding domain-containing protein [Terricaulis silvestris]QGZ95744.1 Response regulator of the LytR/AlgR family protein [Terricaulis silvestris]